MQRTKSKILSILLSLVMLLSLLPTTALAAYPSPTSVSVDGGKRFSSPSQLYYKNNDDAGGFSGSDTDYNAHYDPNTGTLTLQGYEGGSITLDGDEREDLTIKLIGNNKITVNGATATATGIYVSTQKSNITITADSSDNGKLMINVATGSNDAVGIGSNIAATVPGNVTIKGYADVKIDAKTTVKNRSSRGIYAGKVGIEENAKVAITVIAANNTGGPHVYGIYAEGDVTINTAGEITVDASNAGSGDRLYSIGVKSGGNLILTKVGGMTVKWVKNNAGTYGAPLSPAKEFDPSKYDKILDEPNCTVIYTPKVVPPTASVGNVIIDGVKGSPITTAAEVKITLKNDTFASTLSGNWITNLPAGLSQSVSRTDDTHAKITVSGTPTATSSADLAIKIPAENLVTSTSDLDVTKNTNARYKIKASVAALGGSAGITGTAKYNEILTADTSAITGNTGTFLYQWKRNGTDITSATNSTYKLVEDDIGKTITVAISSSVESGTIVSSPTATVEKADSPAAPSVTPVACTNSSNNDGKITGVNTTMEYSAVSDFATKTACTGSEITGLANGTYYVRVAETTTHKAGAAATVIVPAYTSGTLGGSASISGTAKYDEVLTAVTSSITGNTGTFSYQWKRNGTDITSATNSTYKLVEDDIGKTITVAITSSVESGTIVSSPTAAVEKANGPAAPAAFTLSFTLNSDGTTFTATIPTVAGGEYSFDGTNYSATNTKADCAANTGYTGYVRIAATSTHEASTATSSTQTSPKLTVVTPTFTPNGVSGFTGTQSVTISCTTVGATIHYTTDGTEPTASSPVYSAALSLTSTTTVKAIAVKAGMNNSAIATATFTKYSGGGGGGGGSYTPSYTVSVDKTENGTITVSPKSASKGDTVTITVKPDKGYELEMLKALDKDGNALKLTEKNGKYTFTMPTGKVTVKGSFVEETPVQIFKDVPVDAYYYEAVKWAAEKGITGGVGNGRFAPNDPCTRAQIVTFLWRAAGSPTPKNMSSFADVPADAFYAKAVAWAVENGITGGTGDGKFSPNATCSRAQAVTFLYRAAGSPKVSGSAEFGDVATNAYYADAVAWAAKNGITGGIGDGLFGSGDDCTRAQIVTFLYRTYQGK